MALEARGNWVLCHTCLLARAEMGLASFRVGGFLVLSLYDRVCLQSKILVSESDITSLTCFYFIACRWWYAFVSTFLQLSSDSELLYWSSTETWAFIKVGLTGKLWKTSPANVAAEVNGCYIRSCICYAECVCQQYSSLQWCMCSVEHRGCFPVLKCFSIPLLSTICWYHHFLGANFIQIG